MGPVGWGLDHRSLGPVRLANLHIERGPAGWGLLDRSIGLGRRIVAVVHRIETFYFRVGIGGLSDGLVSSLNWFFCGRLFLVVIGGVEAP